MRYVHRLTVAGLASAAAIVGGCLPIPRKHVVPLRIETSGRLHVDGAPAIGVEVRAILVGYPSDCAEATATSITDTDGRFAFTGKAETRRWEVVPLAPSSPRYTVMYCIERGTDVRVLYSESFYAVAPTHVTLDCDLGRTGSAERPRCDAVVERDDPMARTGG